ncbi:TlpA family protein disulfide reductase [Sphingomonas sp. SUN019]|uniref:TlpA disulfide reductase family protein n=1 Tax=Sphingomonas sp. SUN019 TaxID=2937788 RepID=UPI0021640518|nr:TlpA disulfide reductase family protein [Sphingomonas sp. SUN019]UVO51940.1 TlpA family protein disulfide reductase [Sphingomonas sp. SUN019]
MTISLSDPVASRSSKRRKVWLRIAGGLALVLLALVAAGVLRARSFDSGPPPPSLAVSGQLPITLPDGRRAHLRDMIRPGIPTVINLWASWCGPCRSEAPRLAELRRYGRNQLNLVHLNVRDAASSAQDRADFLTAVGLPSSSYAVLDDGRIGELTSAANSLIPRTIVFDGSGTPIATITGYKPLALARIKELVSR